MKFQVGDLVRVREDIKENSYCNLVYFNPDMSPYKGKSFEISSRVGISSEAWHLKCPGDHLKDEMRWVWAAEWLELILDPEDDMDVSKMSLDGIL